MIEVNLVPDIKQELLRAQRARTTVISISILVGIIAVALVVVLGVWTYGIQTARGAIYDGDIKKEHEKLVKVPDLADTLTIQHQLSVLPLLHDQKHVNSRIFDVLSSIIPADPNNISITELTLDSEDSTINVNAQAVNGYAALDAFKKTLDATTFQFTKDGERGSVPLASEITDSDRSFGEDASGQKVLRFTVTFTYPEELFMAGLQNAQIVSPQKTNVTDSYLGVPKSLFSEKAQDMEGND